LGLILTGLRGTQITGSISYTLVKGKVTFNVNDKEQTFYFPKKTDRKYGLNLIKNIETTKVGEIYYSRLKPKEEYEIVMVGTMPIKVEVT
jgi:hypothetical protein